MSTGPHSNAHRLRAVRKTEDDDGSVARVLSERADSLAKGSELSVGVEQCDVDRASRTLLDIDFDHLDFRDTGLEQGAEPFEDDDVVIDQCDPDRFGHGFTLRAGATDRDITRSGD